MKSAFIAQDSIWNQRIDKILELKERFKHVRVTRYGEDFQHRIVQRLGTWQYARCGGSWWRSAR